MGEPERGEALLFFSLLFAQVKDPKAREVIFKGAHREGAKEQRSEEKASPEKRRPEAQALRERRAARPSLRATAERRKAEAPLVEKSIKGRASGAASLAEGAFAAQVP